MRKTLLPLAQNMTIAQVLLTYSTFCGGRGMYSKHLPLPFPIFELVQLT